MNTKTGISQKKQQQGFPIVAIGASAGGLEAFESFFEVMPCDSGMTFILIAHLDPTHVSLLPELIQKHTRMPVIQIRDGMTVAPDHVYVIPPNKQLTILNSTLQLLELSRPRAANLPIDAFFRALAKDQGGNAICIILSGTGSDGTQGVKAIKGSIGMVMVQDQQSAKYDGMPHSAIATGLVDFVLPPDQMPEQLIKYTKHTIFKGPKEFSPVQETASNALQKIYIALRSRTDHDFSQYKKNTICRRIERRMNIHQIDDIEDYVQYLQESEREVDILFKELLIGVTNFFRDAPAFEALSDKYLPEYLQTKADGYTIRVWVTGCSTGEEAYSWAILLQECMLKMNRHFSVQIFATDIDNDAIAVARAGLYPESILSDISAQRLKLYFTREESGLYRIKKSIREMLVFAPQNVIKDPPFTKLDILSCRNLLIYLGQELQKKILPIFHYSLKPEGILFLGSSETIGQSSDLFAVKDKKWKIFTRQASSLSSRPLLNFPSISSPLEKNSPMTQDSISKAEEISAIQLVESILQQSSAPPCAIIDDACNVIYIHGRTGRFLEPAEGKISVNILEMAREGIKPALANAIRKVSLHKQEIVQRGLQLEQSDKPVFIDLTVRPILEQSAMRGLMMVVFEVSTKAVKQGKESTVAQEKKNKPAIKSVEELERELQFTKENLQTTIEELETSNEELKSTNEELQSTNEELQSTNEEMETSKEELQSLNEESSTVNAELQSRIDELSKAHDDMKNLMDSTNIATIFLDTELCIRRFTPKATEIIPLSTKDSGRPIKHFATTLINFDLDRYATQVLDDLIIKEIEVNSKDGDHFLMKIRPYRTNNNVIDGLTITFEDITQLKNINNALHDSEKLYRELFEMASEAIVLVDADSGKIKEANALSHELLGYSRNEFLNRKIQDFIFTDKTDSNMEAFELIADLSQESVEIAYKTKSNNKFSAIMRVKSIILTEKPYFLCAWYKI